MIENKGKNYVIDLRNQAVSEEIASFDSKLEGGEIGEGEERGFMDPTDEGVLDLQHYSEDETSSLNGPFHWQLENYEIF